MELVINAEMTIKQIKANKVKFVSIDRNNIIEVRKGFKLFIFYRMMDRSNRLSPDALYKLKETEWLIPYKALAYLGAIIALSAIVI